MVHPEADVTVRGDFPSSNLKIFRPHNSTKENGACLSTSGTNSEFGTRASVGAVYDRAFFRSLTTARGHRPRLQWYQSHCYALLARIGNVVAGFRPRLHRIIRSMF